MIAELAQGIYDFFSGIFTNLFSFLGDLFSALFEGIKKVLDFLFEPILELIGSIFYFFEQLGYLIMAIINLFINLVTLFVSVMKGLFLTVIGLSYDGSSATLPDSYQKVFDNIQPALQIAQIDKLATLCLWALWVFFGVAIVKIIGSRG